MKKYSIYFLFISMAFITGCKKYLDFKSDAKLVTPETIKDIQGILDDGEKINIKTTPSLGESSADDYFMLPANYATQTLQTQQIYQWIPTDIRYGNDWNLAYQAIYNCNLSLELIDKIERTNANAGALDNVKGSALFLRAFHFLNLLSQYAKAYNESTAASDPGIVLRKTSDFNIPSVRTSVKDGYEQIISDLDQALLLLPDYPLHKMRPSKGAGLALLSRAYLFMGNYARAKAYATDALKLNAFLMDYNSDPSIGNFSATVGVRKLNAETIFHAEQGITIALHGITRARIDTNLVASFATGDLRKTVFFNMISGYAQYKGSYAGTANLFFSGLATDEIYLIRAEANAYLGEIALAMTDLNDLLKKRWNKNVPFIPVTASTPAEALSKVRQERRKELLMRGLRWIDLKRYNREGANITIFRKINGQLISLFPSSGYYAIPIPNDIIELSGMPQN